MNGDGFLDYGEFSRGFIGEMSELRKSLVRKVSLMGLPKTRNPEWNPESGIRNLPKVNFNECLGFFLYLFRFISFRFVSQISVCLWLKFLYWIPDFFFRIPFFF